MNSQKITQNNLFSNLKNLIVIYSTSGLKKINIQVKFKLRVKRVI